MATATDLTRQQLDELDALLQRMLNPSPAAPEPATVAPPPNWRVDPPAAVAIPHLNLTAFPQEPVLAPIDPIEIVLPTPPTEVGLPEPQTSAVVMDSEPILAVLTPVHMDARSTPSVALWPLIAVNWGLEGMLKLFGPPGETLTRRAGKNTLGFAGLLMMCGAGLWAAQGQGWIKLPVERFTLPQRSW